MYVTGSHVPKNGQLNLKTAFNQIIFSIIDCSLYEHIIRRVSVIKPKKIVKINSFMTGFNFNFELRSNNYCKTGTQVFTVKLIKFETNLIWVLFIIIRSVT